MGSKDNLDYTPENGGEAESGRSVDRLYEVFLEKIGEHIPRDRVRIVGRDPLEAVINNSERVIIREGGKLDYRAAFKPLTSSSGRDWGGEAFQDAGDAMFSNRE